VITDRTTALIGNGLSIAYNPALTCQRLTEDLIPIFESAHGPDAVSLALQALARRLQPLGAEVENFEQLLGPIDAIATALTALRDVAELSGDIVHAAGPRISDALRISANFAEDFYRVGVGPRIAVGGTTKPG
jgi:hypothetical protein